MKPKHKRLAAIIASLALVAGAVWLITGSLQQNLLYFYTPTDVVGQDIAMGEDFRLGGMVKDGSVQWQEDGRVDFVITDHASEVPVSYTGAVPSLFKEGQGVIVDGAFDEGRHFQATRILAKHDENYRPPMLKELEKKD